MVQGFDQKADGLQDWPECPPLAVQQSVEATGELLPPVTGAHDGGPVHGASRACVHLHFFAESRSIAVV